MFKKGMKKEDSKKEKDKKSDIRNWVGQKCKSGSDDGKVERAPDLEDADLTDLEAMKPPISKTVINSEYGRQMTDKKIKSERGKEKLNPDRNMIVSYRNQQLESYLDKQKSLVEKYRPIRLEDILGNREVIKSLINCSKNLPNLLLYGPPGTGKTTAILSIAKQLYINTTGNILELNASSERGIGTVREKIKSFGMAQSFNKLKKLIILDEADSLSKDAQNALRRVMEDYSHNVRFCLIANYANKIIPAIISRCCKFRFLPLKVQEIKERMILISQKEGISISEKEVEILMMMAKGDLRYLINTLDGLRRPVIDGSFSSNRFKGTISTHKSLRNQNTRIDESLNLLTPESNQENLINISLIDCEALVILSHKDPPRAYALLDNFLQNNDFFMVFEQLTTYLRNRDISKHTSIFRMLADIEYRIAIGGNENVQIRCLIGVISSSLIDMK